MSVHYKFKAALDFSTVTFDGIHISVAELKKSIIDQKRLGKSADFDLQIINAQTKEVYSDENALIPKNTSVIVARVPVTDKKKSGPPPPKENAQGNYRGMHPKAFHQHQQSGAEVAKGSDLSSMDLSEEEKIKAMMTQSTADYDPSHYVRIRGANQHGRVPDNYRCNKCNQGGHWIKYCPNVPVSQPDVKKSTGIPRSFMVVVDSPDFPGALMTPEGRYAVPAVDHAAYLEKSKGQQTVEQPAKPKIPDDLVCPLCNDLLTDALLVPCCANSYCDDCIRSYLVESEHECPGCHEKDISPTSLIPNRFLRGTVNAFKSDTGYSKPEKVPERPPKSPVKPAEAEEPRKLSLDELPDDLFPHSPKKIDSEAEAANINDPESTKDLYDFNDGSIPSPFASPKRDEVKADPVPVEQRAIQSLSRSFTGGPPQGMMREQMRGGPPTGPPPQHHPPHHMQRKPAPPPGNNEPPPPGFDVLPPGEDGNHRQPPPHGHNGGPGNMGHENNQRDNGPPGPNRGHPPNQQQGQNMQMQMPPNVPPPSFNPMQPPPGYPGPPHGPPPPGPGIPPPGYGPPGPHGPPNPNMPPYPNNFNRLPPPPMNRGPPMHHGGPPPRHHMDHDDFGRGRGRRPYGHGPPLHGRMDEPHREEIVGTIDDPLKEFERLMREKDRRKKMAAVGARKRSKSRSFSPSPRRTPPYPPKRSRSRSFSRSPSPKRKRLPLAGPKRRRSYSRSNSRSPPPIRRVGKSRSRSRNRSLSPTPPGKLRRSPRRAPPQYSPSPPPSRFSRKDKDEYFEPRGGRDGRDRYDDRPGRFQNKSASSYSSRDYDNKFDAPHGKYDNPPPKHDSHSKYDSQRQPARPYHGHLSQGHSMSHDTSSASYRDKPASIDSKRAAFDFESNIAPPGTENPISTVPSLMDINVQQPRGHSANVYPISTIGGGSHAVHPPEIPSDQNKGRRESRDVGAEPVPAAATADRKKSATEEDKDKEQDGDKDRRRKSPVGKKHKKEKKKHKKKSREEKKGKKTKRSKDEKAADEDKSSDDEPETEASVEVGKAIPSILEETKIPTLLGSGGAPPPGAMIPLMDINVNMASDNNVAAAKQTAPCDSTVKSPDRVHELDPNGTNKDDPMAGEKTVPVTTESMKRRDSLTAVAPQVEGDVPPPQISDDTMQTPAQEKLLLPPSKWDEYEDYLTGGEPSKAAPVDLDIPGGAISAAETKREPVDRIVTSEVLKRAENVIFDKPLKAISDPKPPSPSDQGVQEPRSYDKAFREDIPVQAHIVQQVKPDLKSASVVSTVFRKSAKDRLGSKLSEDEVILNVNKAIEPSSISVRSKVSAVRESSDSTRRRRSRSRSPAYASSRYRNRSRSRSLDRLRNRSRHSSERQQRLQPQPEKDSRRSPIKKLSPSPSCRNKDRRRSNSRERRHSTSRDRRRSTSRRRSASRERRRSISRENKRSASKGSRDRRRSPSAPRERIKRSPPRERRRSRSRERERERRRSNSRSRSKRSRSRERRRSRSRERRRSNSRDRSRRSRSGDKKRSPSRERIRRSTSRDHYRPRLRSPAFRRPGESSRGKDDPREEAFRGKEPSEKIRLNLLEERKEPNLPRSGDNSSTAMKLLEEPPSPEARVFQQSGGVSGRSDQVFSPTLKKQKGRINIKLSSISKTEQQQSGSSSSDDDQQTTGSKHSDSGDEKRRKKRRHSSTSTKSSSSSDTKRKKKKKEKKKKKKKKKSK